MVSDFLEMAKNGNQTFPFRLAKFYTC